MNVRTERLVSRTWDGRLHLIPMSGPFTESKRPDRVQATSVKFSRAACENRDTARAQAIFPILEYLVVFTTQPPFVRRNNADGTIDSICRKCLFTIASSHTEADLERAEGKHQCDPVRLEYLKHIVSQP
jgi:hypothetical protein